MQTITPTKLYAIRDIIPASGSYLCIPCGYVQYFEKGEKFTECLACLAGTSFGPAGFQSDADEFWQLL